MDKRHCGKHPFSGPIAVPIHILAEVGGAQFYAVAVQTRGEPMKGVGQMRPRRKAGQVNPKIQNRGNARKARNACRFGARGVGGLRWFDPVCGSLVGSNGRRRYTQAEKEKWIAEPSSKVVKAGRSSPKLKGWWRPVGSISARGEPSGLRGFRCENKMIEEISKDEGKSEKRAKEMLARMCGEDGREEMLTRESPSEARVEIVPCFYYA